MPIKVWIIEAHNIKYGRLSLWVESGFLHWTRDYHFTDDQDNPLQTPNGEGVGSFAEGSMPWEEVPEHIQDALIDIDDFTKEKIKQIEEID